MATSSTLPEQIREVVERLSPDDQQRVLEFAQVLTQSRLPAGTPGSALLRFAGAFSPETIAAMEQALEDSERIDLDEY